MERGVFWGGGRLSEIYGPCVISKHNRAKKRAHAATTLLFCFLRFLPEVHTEILYVVAGRIEYAKNILATGDVIYSLSFFPFPPRTFSFPLGRVDTSIKTTLKNNGTYFLFDSYARSWQKS